MVYFFAFASFVSSFCPSFFSTVISSFIRSFLHSILKKTLRMSHSVVSRALCGSTTVFGAGLPELITYEIDLWTTTLRPAPLHCFKHPMRHCLLRYFTLYQVDFVHCFTTFHCFSFFFFSFICFNPCLGRFGLLGRGISICLKVSATGFRYRKFRHGNSLQQLCSDCSSSVSTESYAWAWISLVGWSCFRYANRGHMDHHHHHHLILYDISLHKLG